MIGTLRMKKATLFTDPPYGLPKEWVTPLRSLNFSRVFIALMTSGELMLLDSLSRPNGIGIIG